MKSTAVLHQGALGDQLLALPMLNELRKNHTITYLGRPPGLDFVKHFIKIKPISLDAREGLQFILHPDRFSHEKIILIGKAPWDGDISTPTIKLSTTGKQQQKWKEWALQCGYPHAQPFKAHHSPTKKMIVIAPGSGSKNKNWSLDHFLALQHHFDKDTPVTWLLGPAEEHYIEICRKNAHGDLLISPSSQQLLQLFSTRPFYIGNDSGISHLAGIHQCPGIAFFQTSNSEVWRPQGNTLMVIQNKHPHDNFDFVVTQLNKLWTQTL